MADQYEGKQEALTPAEIVEKDETTGTPPKIPAGVRTGVYISAVTLNALTFLVLGILPALGLLDRAVSAEIGLTVVTFIDMICFGLAVGYRPTRPGSPIAP